MENAELRRRLRELQAENERLAESQGIVKQETYDVRWEVSPEMLLYRHPKENDLLQQKAAIIDRQVSTFGSCPIPY